MLGALAPGASRRATLGPVLLGRERELFAIDQALAAARLGKSARLVIRGEPGIGKTALLEYAIEHAGSMRVLTARGVDVVGLDIDQHGISAYPEHMMSPLAE